MFKRSIIKQLEQWKDKPDRKPLMLLGARQVGKTFVLKQFGKESFEHCAYFSVDEENGVADIFRKTKNPIQIVEQLSFLCDKPIKVGKTLLILDEIQSCPEAISSLKYFCENMPDLALACAGSLLGLAFGIILLLLLYFVTNFLKRSYEGFISGFLGVVHDGNLLLAY